MARPVLLHARTPRGRLPFRQPALGDGGSREGVLGPEAAGVVETGRKKGSVVVTLDPAAEVRGAPLDRPAPAG